MNVAATCLLWFWTINLQSNVGTSSDCIRGFPNIPVSEVGHHTKNITNTTVLIPGMNFTCNASIVGFIVAGRALDREPHSQIQIWRKNSSQNSAVYYRASHSVNVSVPNARSGGVCMAARRIIGNTFWCILKNNMQFTVQSGDILGLVLPNTTNNEILLTNGGPVNHVFELQGQLGSYVNLSTPYNRNYSVTQLLPQIAFNLTSGKQYPPRF